MDTLLSDISDLNTEDVEKEKISQIFKKLPGIIKEYIGSDEIKDEIADIIVKRILEIINFDSFEFGKIALKILEISSDIASCLEKNRDYLSIRIIVNCFIDNFFEIIQIAGNLTSITSKEVIKILSNFFSNMQSGIKRKISKTVLTEKEKLILEIVSDVSILSILTVYEKKELLFDTKESVKSSLEMIENATILTVKSLLDLFFNENKLKDLIEEKEKNVCIFLISAFGETCLDIIKDVEKLDLFKKNDLVISKTVINLFIDKSISNIKSFLDKNGLDYIEKSGHKVIGLLAILKAAMGKIFEGIEKSTDKKQHMSLIMTNLKQIFIYIFENI